MPTQTGWVLWGYYWSCALDSYFAGLKLIILKGQESGNFETETSSVWLSFTSLLISNLRLQSPGIFVDWHQTNWEFAVLYRDLMQRKIHKRKWKIKLFKCNYKFKYNHEFKWKFYIVIVYRTCFLSLPNCHWCITV